MQKVKKSLTVAELADKIKKLSKPGVSGRQIMAELRKTYTFSKDKWNAARKGGTSTPKPLAPVKTTKKNPPKTKEPTLPLADADMKPFWDSLGKFMDSAERTAAAVFDMLKKYPLDLSTVETTPDSSPMIFEVLERACDAGLLKEVRCYALGDDLKQKYLKAKAPKKTTKSTRK